MPEVFAGDPDQGVAPTLRPCGAGRATRRARPSSHHAIRPTRHDGGEPMGAVVV